MPPPSEPAPHGSILFSPRGELAAAVVMGGCLLGGWLAGALAADEGPWAWAAPALTWASLALGLVYGGRAALLSLAKREFDIDVLMFLGAVLAAYLGAPGEGALLLFLFTLSGALEELAMARTTRAVEALHKLMPTAALRLEGDAWVHVEPERLAPGDRVRILPGELVPADARLAAGSTAVNQANLTGESMPRDVFEGDQLFAGTLNVGNPVEAEVLRAAGESSLQKILRLVTEAQQQRAPVQRLIDRWSQPYAIGVTAASLLVFLLWWGALGFSFKDATTTGITLLIVASPCALIIATPTATLAAISRAARGGVLFKGGDAIERLASLRAVAFDKTGTLTIGRPKVHEVRPVAWSHGTDLLAVAAGLEAHSTHPIAEAIVAAAAAAGTPAQEATDVRYVPGRGVEGSVDGLVARLGSMAHCEELVPVCLRAKVREVLQGVQSRGRIAVVCAWNEMAAVFILSDAVRPGAECLVERLHAQGVAPVVMLTGDNRATAEGVARTLQLDEFHAELLPDQKVAHVRRLREQAGAGGPAPGRAGVGVIGDGVNDAPALSTADVAIAIGSIGSDAALESADIVLLSDDLSTVPWAVGLARRARRTIQLNLGFAIGAIGLMAVAALAGSLLGRPLPLWMGVIGHEGGTLLVVAHSLLLLAYRGIPVCACRQHAHAHEENEPSAPPAMPPPAPGGSLVVEPAA